MNPGGWDATIVTAIVGPGFAALVAWYLLTRILPAVQELTRGVDKLQNSVELGAEKMNIAQSKMQNSVDRLNDSVSYLARNTPQQRMGDKPPGELT